VATSSSNLTRNSPVVVAGLVSLNKKTKKVSSLKATIPMECNVQKHSAEDATATLVTFLMMDQNQPEKDIA
jgi:hypothetical protein